MSRKEKTVLRSATCTTANGIPRLEEDGVLSANRGKSQINLRLSFPGPAWKKAIVRVCGDRTIGVVDVDFGEQSLTARLLDKIDSVVRA